MLVRGPNFKGKIGSGVMTCFVCSLIKDIFYH